ncbi:DNA polymerase III subunit psi [Aliivibrio sp. S4TY2]|uniref:DNA polymerase III subunit psi n=1 Tax=unclassified Aliivibrio TaxID=2645654 RepID=UPI002377D47C|nr:MULTISPECIES: DNA polymerase III subunit psi [unclassified Aliivibrio]MDD9157249.1 DNA polymerase III subunit psi [Aliivibrio sp. S4TY2]MDD9161131.1 DNA polymerase III subunit psi [Aliivibrio sp. S4TY1]MDD9165161.1 DNA polymerase III subunit psi [Aliivibrio sp. S4MY2]MDD9169159.1 DNA polymerase III subunit psi [Aliivibrio sp. S4MY4]MDD9186018.1 DNA polymerase III subunit psi [Aliivibrio sp. S4MY3]
MPQQALQFLNEMNISVWQVRQPEYFPTLEANTISLPETCQLLFVAPAVPTERDAFLFGKVLASMKLLPEQALFLPSSALEYLAEHKLAWSWFSGVPITELEGVKALSSPLLSEMHTNTQSRRDLWRQICSYDH